MIRIISGKHRGRSIETPDSRKTIRPTSGRTREALFNILSHGQFSGASPLVGQHIVDLFCGTGALGIEALSRGAAQVTFVDQSQDSLNLVRRTLEKLGEMNNARLLRSDSSSLPPSRGEPCALALLDPPYNSGLAPVALKSLLAGRWLEEGAVAAVELSARESFVAPNGFSILDQRKYGNSVIIILRRS